MWAALIAATLYLCYFHNLGVIGLVGPDEPRYAWIARDMAETGDWVTPRLYGQPWFEKPVLYYWGAALSFKIFGVSEAAARLPSALSALLATLALAWLAWRLYGGETARWLLLLLPTSVGMIGFSHAAATDMPFSAMLTIAMVFGFGLLRLLPSAESGGPDSFSSSTSSTYFDSAFFGFFLGLAVLAKGPAALILSGGAIFFWAVWTKRWRDAFRSFHPLAVVTFCVTALPWYIVCARRNPEFFRVFIIEHNFKRYLTPEFQHVQPVWFYVPILLIAFLPWALPLLWSAYDGTTQWMKKRTASHATLLLFLWAVFCLVFFTVSKSKLPGYILPSVPPLGLLLARAVARLNQQSERTFRWLLVSFSALAGVASLPLLWFGRSLRATGKPAGIVLISSACVLLLFAVANLLLANRANRETSLRLAAPLCVAPILLLLVAFRWVAAPWLSHDPSGKTVAAEIESHQLPTDRLFVQSMHRGQQFGLNFYLHRETRVWDAEHPSEGVLLRNTKSCEVAPPLRCSDNAIPLGATGWFAYEIRKPAEMKRD